jgi:hypothetical protein
LSCDIRLLNAIPMTTDVRRQKTPLLQTPPPHAGPRRLLTSVIGHLSSDICHLTSVI